MDKPDLRSASQDLVPFWPGTANSRDLALAYMDIASRTHKEADYRRAFAALDKAVPEAGEDPDVLSDLGYLNDMAGNPAKAVRLYERALSSDPQNMPALTNLGQHLATEGKILSAIQLWQRAVKTDPGLAAPSLNLAYALLQQGNVPDARSAIENLLRFNPDSSKGLALKNQIDHASK